MPQVPPGEAEVASRVVTNEMADGPESHRDLIAAARSVLHPHRVADRLFGDVAAALVTDRGARYLGVCIDTGSGTGFCAEPSMPLSQQW